MIEIFYLISKAILHFFSNKLCFITIRQFSLSSRAVATISCFTANFYYRAGADVQWRECAGEPPPGRGLQAPAEPRLWYIRQPQQEAATNPQEDGYWYGENIHQTFMQTRTENDYKKQIYNSDNQN